MRLTGCLSLRRANGPPVAAWGYLVDCRCVGFTGCLSLRVIIWLPELAWDELTVVSIWLKTSTREVVNRRPWLLAPLAAVFLHGVPLLDCQSPGKILADDDVLVYGSDAPLEAAFRCDAALLSASVSLAYPQAHSSDHRAVDSRRAGSAVVHD